jgi:hypothetical protein
VKLSEMISFDKKAGQFIVANQAERVDQMLREIAYQAQAGYDIQDTHAMLAAAIVEPIRLTVPYVEMYSPMFFRPLTYGDLEDNALPIEDIPTVAWETHRDGQVMFVRANYRWTRPSFTTYDIGVEVQWDDLRKSGWNHLERQMRYATENLARKRDVAALAVLVAAIPAGHADTVAGGSLTRASVKGVLKEAQTIGFPMTQCLVNAGTVTDMAEWTFPTGQVVDPGDEGLMTNLYLGTYGGCRFTTNPHASTTVLYFSGPPVNTGYHQQRGAMKTASDVDIRKKIDLHAIYDMDHAWYVGNGYNLRSLTITA